MNSMRVAIITPVFPPYRGGIGTVVALDAESIRRLGATVDVYTPAYNKAKERDRKQQGATMAGVYRLKSMMEWGNAAVLPSLITRLKGYDLIHLHYPFFGSDIITAFAAKLYGIPLVVTYHMHPKASGILGLTFRIYQRVLQPIIFHYARAILVSSKDYADEHHIHHRDLVVHPFGVDTIQFAPEDKKDALPTIVFVGGLDAAHYFKGVDVLLTACSLMTAPYRLLIVGDGEHRPIFEAMAKNFGITNHVQFLGAVSFEDLPDVYQSADVHVLPSIDQSEAFGIVTLEAMASGIPTVVSNLPGARSLVVQEETGLIVEPKDASALALALDRFCNDRIFAKACGEKARERVCAQYDDTLLAKRLFEVYNRLV